jgi:hypothetical protein
MFSALSESGPPVGALIQQHPTSPERRPKLAQGRDLVKEAKGLKR